MELQTANGWSDEETAEALGITLEKYRGDNVTWSATALRVLSDECHVSCEYLLGRTDRKRPFNVMDEIDERVSDAMAKVLLLQNMFEVQMDIEGCSKAITFLLDGMARDLCGINEVLERVDGSKLIQY